MVRARCGCSYTSSYFSSGTPAEAELGRALVTLVSWCMELALIRAGCSQ